ncbi:MAG: excinuclease ABC subunit UvrC [Clostridiaceae bacterium]|jgi:excinuclease ABC subunit C|nr:excinuclease ABC subunit UvrC [Bacillota bacterium]NLI38036.1 excinuclease ABC subunit UvrC [Clostridiaceae bacterium]
MKATIKETLKNLPDSPGVYIMRDQDDKVIYVGKAKVLKNRVRSYFRKMKDRDVKTATLVSNVQSLEYIVTHTEEEALILENTLIKRYRPKYNILLKDDKTYPHIRISIQEDYPRIEIVRKIQKDGARYFGTYVNVGAVRESMELIRRLFPIRTCKRSISPDKKQRPCLYYHIGLCSAPCSGNISKQDYNRMVQNACAFLDGRQDEVIKKLEDEMKGYAEELKFEKAAAIRDRLKSVSELMKKQVVYSTKAEERDVIGLYFDDWNCAASVLSIRSGRLVGKRSFVLEGMGASTMGAVMDSFVLQYYDANPEIPREIALQYEPESTEVLAEILSKKRGGKVSILVPQRGVKAELVDMAEQNAREELELFRNAVLARNAQSQEVLKKLKSVLKLDKIPGVIEAYDISNTGDTEIVASMVVFRDARAERRLYRRFKMKAITGQNDYGSMQETLLRRFMRYLDGSEDDSFGTLPDLLLVDGGAAHVSAAREVLADLGIEVPVWGMAKDDRHRSHRLVNGQMGIDLGNDHEILRFIASVQNEAHRYALEYNRNLRRKRHRQSVLDQIPGIGEARKKALLRDFGSVKKIREASIEEISAVKGIGPGLAAIIKERLQK